MLRLIYLLISPILVIFSIPLSLFAALTTTLAFSTLFLRALLVYAELGAVLIRNTFLTPHAYQTTLAVPPAPAAEGKPPRQHRSRGSSAGSGGSKGGSATPRVPDIGVGLYSGGGVVRDYEGVGGVRHFLVTFPFFKDILAYLTPPGHF